MDLVVSAAEAPAIPSRCRAAALVEPGRPLEIIDVPVPDELEDGALLVRMSAATICGTDVHVRNGSVDNARSRLRLPVILGHEMTGRVVAFGAGPRTDSLGQALAVGDRVVWTHGMCGRCHNCVVERSPSLCTNRRRYMSENAFEYPFLNGGFSEYGYVYPTAGRVRVPDDVPDPLAAASSCALRTVIHAFDRLGPLDHRYTVVVQGAGPLGLFSLARALVAGAGQVIMVGGPRARLELAERWGAARCLDVAELPDPAQRLAVIRELTGGRGADVVIEMSGMPSAFTEGIDMLASGGRYLVVGQSHSEHVPFNPSIVMFKQLSIIGTLSGSVEHYWRALDFLRRYRDRFSWSDMLSAARPLTQTNEALDAMASWREIKPVIILA